MHDSRIRYAAVLFDLDGTLIDSAPDLVETTNRLLRREKRPPLPYSLLRSYVSDGAAGLIKRSFGEEQPKELLEERRRVFLADYGGDPLRYGTRIFNGMEKLPSLLRTVPWGIVTNKNRFLTERICDGIPLLRQAQVLVCGGDLEQLKPHPLPVLRACEQLEVAAAETLFVGDNAKDMEAGRQAGADTMAVLYGYHRREEDPQGWDANYYVPSPRLMLSKLKELFQGTARHHEQQRTARKR